MDDPCDVAVVLQEGIDCLQRAVELETAPSAAAAWQPAQDPELLSDFILESREHLAGIEAQVLTIEREPLDAEALNSVFRGFHTIKGLAGFLELWEVQKLAHEVETILDRARNSQFTHHSARHRRHSPGRRLPAPLADTPGIWVSSTCRRKRRRGTNRCSREFARCASQPLPDAPEATAAELAALAAAVEAPPVEERAIGPRCRRSPAAGTKPWP